SFTLSASPVVSWLTPTANTGFASANSPAVIGLNVNPIGQPVGTQTTNLMITPTSGGATAPAPVPVSLVIGVNPLLQLSSTSLTFAAPFSQQAPAPQQVTLTTTGTGTAVGFTVSSDSSWLPTPAVSSFVASASAPATLSIQVNPFALAVGTYTGNL